MNAGCRGDRAARSGEWAPARSHDALVFAPQPVRSAGAEDVRRDASLGVEYASAHDARWFPDWAASAQAPALRPWPPYNSLRGQRAWDRFWRDTPRRRW